MGIFEAYARKVDASNTKNNAKHHTVVRQALRNPRLNCATQGLQWQGEGALHFTDTMTLEASRQWDGCIAALMHCSMQQGCLQQHCRSAATVLAAP